jgi:two-component system sensor histidine kinase YesM
MEESILDMTIPSMILQPLAENFFKHTYEEGFSSAHLLIKGSIQDGHLNFLVKNDGPGLTAARLETLRNNIYTPPFGGAYSTEHIGLKNIRDRLLLRYGPGAQLYVDSMNGKGFSVRMKIPVSGEGS